MDTMAVHLRSIDPKIPLLSAAEWNAIALVTEWLKPFRDATTRMPAARSPTLSTVYAVFRELEDNIRSILSTLQPVLRPRFVKDCTNLIENFRTTTSSLTKHLSTHGLRVSHLTSL